MRKRGIKRKRLLPERYRPLAALTELCNLVTDEQVREVRAAEAGLLGPSGPEQKIAAAEALNGTYQALAAAVDERPKEKAHLEAVAGVLPSNQLFLQLADARDILREVAMLGRFNAHARLPESVPPTLGAINGMIRLVSRPAWMWMLPLLDGLELGRLSRCEYCANLYVSARKDQLGCSKGCGDVLYMRKYRAPDYRNRNEPVSKRQIVREARNVLIRKSNHMG
jgi:hypothetical protein